MTIPITDQPHEALPHQERAFLEINQLSKTYLEGDRPRSVLKDMSLKSSRGERIAILGRSGSGKTTLLNLISGIDQVDYGEIWLDGTSLTALNDHQRTLFRREKIGFIFQFFNLISTLTVWENITLPLELNGIAPEIGHPRVEELLDAVGLRERAHTFPDRLSGGEQQRVALARAFVHDPLLILADEPTGNLDEETGYKVMDLIDKIVRRTGKNLILVTHSMEAASHADRIFTLHDGHLEEISHLPATV